jgi:hypothetical protein
MYMCLREAKGNDVCDLSFHRYGTFNQWVPSPLHSCRGNMVDKEHVDPNEFPGEIDWIDLLLRDLV